MPRVTGMGYGQDVVCLGRSITMFTSKREAVLVLSVWIGGGLVFVLLLCNVLFGVIQAPPPTTRADVGPPEAYLRADAFLVLWTPGTTLPVDQIRVFADGRASRAFFPLSHPRAFVTVSLPADLLQDLDVLRNQWCAMAPTVAPPADNAGVYTCAIQCRPFHTPTYQIPADHLPAPLEDLMEMMPPAPTGVPMTPGSRR